MPKKTEDDIRRYGVLQADSGSYALDGVRFEAFTTTPVDAATVEKACPDNSPVKFFDTAEQAAADVARLRAEHAAKPKN